MRCPLCGKPITDLEVSISSDLKDIADNSSIEWYISRTVLKNNNLSKIDLNNEELYMFIRQSLESVCNSAFVNAYSMEVIRKQYHINGGFMLVNSKLYSHGDIGDCPYGK